MAVNKGGRGKKSPYQTVTVRVPLPVKDVVNYIADEYRANRVVPITPFEFVPCASPETQAVYDAYVSPHEQDWIDENLWQIEAYNASFDKVPVMPSRDDALEKMAQILKSKKSAKQSLEKLINYIYPNPDVEVL